MRPGLAHGRNRTTGVRFVRRQADSPPRPAAPRSSARSRRQPVWPANAARPLALGIPAIDGVLGGGLSCGALHEIAAARETETAAATGFALALAALKTSPSRRGARALPDLSAIGPDDGCGRNDDGAVSARVPGRYLLWIVEDLALVENGAPYGPGLDAAGIAPERLITVAAVARARRVVGDGGSAALPRRRRGDRRDAPARHRSGGDAPARARGRRRRHARPHPAHRAGRCAVRRRDALDHRRGAVFSAVSRRRGKTSRRRSAALGRASRAQPPWSSRSMDRGVEQCGAAFRARNAF